MYILLYTRTAVVLVVDAHKEVPAINTVGIIRMVIIRAHLKGACFAIPICFASHNTWLTGPAVGLARSACINTCIVKGKVARIIEARKAQSLFFLVFRGKKASS